MEKIEIGANIKALREKFGLSQEELADKLWVSAQAVSKWENDDSIPSIENLVRISGLFKVSIDALVKGVGAYLVTDNVSSLVDFKLRYIYNKYQRGEDIESNINTLINNIIKTKADDLFTFGAKQTLKATIYAMLEDKNINEESYNLATLKNVLQFSNLDSEDQSKKIKEYFKDKSKKCAELINIYTNNAATTAANILSFVISGVNSLDF